MILTVQPVLDEPLFTRGSRHMILKYANFAEAS
jgi:hypothetical protein